MKQAVKDKLKDLVTLLEEEAWGNVQGNDDLDEEFYDEFAKLANKVTRIIAGGSFGINSFIEEEFNG